MVDELVQPASSPSDELPPLPPVSPSEELPPLPPDPPRTLAFLHAGEPAWVLADEVVSLSPASSELSLPSSVSEDGDSAVRLHNGHSASPSFADAPPSRPSSVSSWVSCAQTELPSCSTTPEFLSCRAVSAPPRLFPTQEALLNCPWFPRPLTPDDDVVLAVLPDRAVRYVTQDQVRAHSAVWDLSGRLMFYLPPNVFPSVEIPPPVAGNAPSPRLSRAEAQGSRLRRSARLAAREPRPTS
ncbi:hypothetical protein BD626DRAFT_583715 [Schizophyllum amplum]|uniref:Uncharacterized protein n=1 Tax=Schizophyllum amplum TaxID=97359 RepID=A0A550CEW6_9AGAR|nr:hypothetical protein BD626DRAFT_583715 [Auriculariopsis ampla]